MAIPYYPSTSWWAMHSILIHSLLTVVAVVIAYYIGHKEAKRQKLNLDMFYNSALWMFAGALIGGRIAFVVFGSNYSDFNPANIVNFFSFHMGFHSVGVVLGGGLGLMGYCLYKKDVIKKKYKRLDIFLWSLTDIWVLGAAIGIFFYRIGGFIGGLHPGIETTVPWAVDYYGKSVHPLTLYYSLAGMVIFVILLEVKRRKIKENIKYYMGRWFLFTYSFSRFLLDFLRDYEFEYKGIGSAQWIFLILMLMAIWRPAINKIIKSYSKIFF